MTRDEAVDLIKLRLGRRTDLDDQIVAEMKLAQVELEQGQGLELPWFLRKRVELETHPDEPDVVDLPGDYLGLAENDALRWLDGSKWRRLFRRDYGATQDAEPGSVDLVPNFWDLVGFEIMLSPEPDAAGWVRLPYYGAAAALAEGTTTNAWLTYAPEVLISACGLKVAAHIRDPEAQKSFAGTLQLAQDTLRRETISRQIEGEDLQMQFGGATR